jgi:type I restriction enzyme S subunit
MNAKERQSTETEVGLVPSDWRVASLGSLMEFQNGFNADRRAYGSGTAFVNVLEVITNSHLTSANVPGRVRVTPMQFRAFEVRYGDVLFNRTSETQDEVALASVYLSNEPVVFGGFVIRARPDHSQLCSPYAGFGLRAPAVRSQLVARGQGAVRANVGQADLRKILIALPPFAEQEAIASALSGADALIAALEALMAKKRDVKRGAMQELLTGQRRLPGFSGNWEVRRLDQLADIRSGGTPSTSRPDYWDGVVPWCTPTDITALNEGKYLRVTQDRISEAGLKNSSAELIPALSVLMTSRATIGECAINTVPMATNQGFKNFVPFAGTDVEFLFYILGTKKQDFIALCGGSTFLEIGKRQLRLFAVRVPANLDEQQAIAAVLSDLDAELAALEAKLAKAREVKQGMMQVLLTGEVRLV